jgi:hypothetical protein
LITPTPPLICENYISIVQQKLVRFCYHRSHLGGAPHVQTTTGATVRCFRFMVEHEMASHLNMFREKTGGKKHVSRIAYNMYKSKFKAPTVKEGFTDVVEVTFVAEFDDEATRKQFEQQT